MLCTMIKVERAREIESSKILALIPFFDRIEKFRF